MPSHRLNPAPSDEAETHIARRRQKSRADELSLTISTWPIHAGCFPETLCRSSHFRVSPDALGHHEKGSETLAGPQLQSLSEEPISPCQLHILAVSARINHSWQKRRVKWCQSTTASLKYGVHRCPKPANAPECAAAPLGAFTGGVTALNGERLANRTSIGNSVYTFQPRHLVKFTRLWKPPDDSRNHTQAGSPS